MTDLLDPTAQELAPPATRLYDTAPHRSAERPAGTGGGPSRRPPSRGHVPLQVAVILLVWLLLFIVLGFLVSLNPPARPHVVPRDRDPVTVTTPRATGSAPRDATVPSRVSASPRAPAGGTDPQSVAGTRPPAGPTTGEDRDTAGADVPAVSRPSTTVPGSAATVAPPASVPPAAPPATVPSTTDTTAPPVPFPDTTQPPPEIP